MNKPTFLRNLKIRKVDLVDQGANQHAHIRLAKRNDETSETTEATGEEKAFFARIGAGVAKLFRAEAEKVDNGGAQFPGDFLDSIRNLFSRRVEHFGALRIAQIAVAHYCLDAFAHSV